PRLIKEFRMAYSRREFGKLTLAGLPASSLWIGSTATLTAAAKPNSKWAGVQVDMNVPYNFGTGNYTTGDEIIDRCVQLGISGVELRAQPVELFMGSPAAIAGAANAGRGRGRGRGGNEAGAARGEAGAGAGSGRADAPPAAGGAGAGAGREG